MSSGERKRMMAKPCACDTCRGLRMGGRGSVCPVADEAGASDKTLLETNRFEGRTVVGDSPVVEAAGSRDCVSQVARASWNPE